MKRLAQAYAELASSDFGQIVIQDLYDFTRPQADMDCSSHAAMCLHEGLRRVFLRIQKLSGMSDNELARLLERYEEND